MDADVKKLDAKLEKIIHYMKSSTPVKAQMCAEGTSDGNPLKCATGWVPKYTTKPGGAGDPIPCKHEVCTQDEDFSVYYTPSSSFKTRNDPTCCVKANTCDGARFGKQALTCGDGSEFDENMASKEYQPVDEGGSVDKDAAELSQIAFEKDCCKKN